MWPYFVVLGILALIVYTQVTIFVVQPIGAILEGRTLIIVRLNKTEFIDGADATCVRIQGGVNLMWRMVTMAAVMKNTTIFMRLPYGETLYLISTGGKTYDR